VLGVPGFTSTSFGGLLAPARTPPDVVAALRAGLVGALAEPAVRTRLESLGATVATEREASPDGFAAFLGDELSRARRAAELAGLRPE
jgi:tripartite-type tricarboxylate transporter receptor subunit TctC